MKLSKDTGFLTYECPFCSLYMNESKGLAALYFNYDADLTDITVLSGLYPNQNPRKTGNLKALYSV